MGIITWGVLGGFRNKTGAVIGSRFRNRDVIKGLTRPSNKPATLKQLFQRSKFALVTAFLSSFSNFIELFYGNRSASNSPMNEAVSYHLTGAVTTVGTAVEMDYTKVRFARGKLLLPSQMNLAATAPGKVDFEWTDQLAIADHKYKDASDMANLLVYNPTKKQFVSLMGAAPRSAGVFKLQLPPEFGEDYVHGWMNFSSVLKDGLVSDSHYVGKIMIVAMN
ncbi:hypothetical protein FBD94_09810 [Pedobacter hiemivivus]|uniref:Uncharacterized protein n=1 Tax=Pedobacter hiemivivus TaxID=2530454 RepID=A0A4U1GH56_9SPHI|nr:DUF6266 family protein [Pedobacter hiemivivus]TCC99549.1 hypothetical protein EZ444_02420 [Pedobacter hiemivivus]TKC62499.1 hypothetical protein FBD94_09810 [Pedobacter hiemivivus]